jgi:hypothetical protein
MKTLAVLFVCALLAACGGSYEESTEPTARQETAVLFDEFGDYRSVPSPTVRDYIKRVMMPFDNYSTIEN